MFRKSEKELEEELQSTRPTPKTKIKPIKIIYHMRGKEREEVFTDKENLLWVLSHQNPLNMRILRNKYPFLEINGLGKSVSVKDL